MKSLLLCLYFICVDIPPPAFDACNCSSDDDGNSDGGSGSNSGSGSDCDGVVAGLTAALVIALIVVVISVVLNVILLRKKTRLGLYILKSYMYFGQVKGIMMCL